MKLRFILPALLLLTITSCKREIRPPEDPVEIIPRPTKITYYEGSFDLSNPVELKTDQGVYLSEIHLKSLKAKMNSDNSAKRTGTVIFRLTEDETYSNEGYQLIVGKNRIQIMAKAEAGLFYGMQSLLQLIEKSENNKIQCMEITDIPKFEWRGMHLDVCRHFFPVEFVKKYIDLLAMHKMNTFHWHLTEDQGWRIEIKQYPKLTEIGSVREATMVGKNWDEFDGQPYGGYYTQEEIKEVVAYAQERYITIVPEIEMPGHSLAALAAYPEYGCTGGPYDVAKTWGVFEDVYCAGKDSTFIFLQNVLSEVMELFPGEYIHIGGDECPKTRWEECEDCQARMEAEGLKDEAELQSYFIRRIEQFLLKNNRQLIGWDEILEGGLAPEATVMSWRGEAGGIEAAHMGHDVVMCPNDICYFDHYQGPPEEEPLAIGGMTTLEDVYHYHPVPEELEAEQEHHILGAQGNLWTEYIPTPEKLEYMALPRLCALSEVVWTNREKMNWNSFKQRMEKHYGYLNSHNYNYRKETN